MFVYFIVAIGTLVGLNYLLAAQARSEALKLLAFLLTADLGSSTLLHMLAHLPAKAAWSCISDFVIILVFTSHRQMFNTRPVLRLMIPFGYLAMIGLNATTLVSHGISQPLCDYARDAIFVVLLATGMISGAGKIRDGLGTVSGRRVTDLYIRRGDHTVR